MPRGRRSRTGPSGAARTRLPLRRSLLGRLLAVSALVAACSVVATAWLAAQTTSGAIRQEQGQNLTADTRIYNTLLGYAAAHPGGTVSRRPYGSWPGSPAGGSP